MQKKTLGLPDQKLPVLIHVVAITDLEAEAEILSPLSLQAQVMRVMSDQSTQS